MIKSRYNGGNNGWGQLEMYCADCGELVAVYNCDEDGIPNECIFDDWDVHECPEEEEEEEEWQ